MYPRPYHAQASLHCSCRKHLLGRLEGRLASTLHRKRCSCAHIMMMLYSMLKHQAGMQSRRCQDQLKHEPSRGTTHAVLEDKRFVLQMLRRSQDVRRPSNGSSALSGRRSASMLTCRRCSEPAKGRGRHRPGLQPCRRPSRETVEMWLRPCCLLDRCRWSDAAQCSENVKALGRHNHLPWPCAVSDCMHTFQCHFCSTFRERERVHRSWGQCMYLAYPCPSQDVLVSAALSGVCQLAPMQSSLYDASTG